MLNQNKMKQVKIPTIFWIILVFGLLYIIWTLVKKPEEPSPVWWVVPPVINRYWSGRAIERDHPRKDHRDSRHN